ncbi:hypothetical protein [Paraburkholderia domus]|uniref:Uncharacterized protein n=1 Tax=Paraburkholderia domus TaxID=2793075 RepID=A0A9N8N6K7_9BURK|nr:hypothetical protein [Paraburkholderia domus]MBK5169432.1 hypothetical protein [Burkholderia sp. R-70211]CAE6959855.1 hypothetical protein R70211_06865 [Paraburkholderia domus]
MVDPRARGAARRTGGRALGPLTERSGGQTQKIVTSLFDWLRDVGYLQLNPATGLPTVGRREPEKQGRFLSPNDTALLRAAIAARPGAESGRGTRQANARDLFAVDLFAVDLFAVDLFAVDLFAVDLFAVDLFAVDLFERTGMRTTEVMQCRMGHVCIEPVPHALRREFPDAPPFQWLLRVERDSH